MTPKDLAEKLDSFMTKDEVGSIIAQLGEDITSKLDKLGTPDPAPPASAESEDTEEAELETSAVKSATKSIMDTEVWGIPVGKAALGGFGAIFASELIDGFMTEQSKNVRGIVKLVVAGASAQWGKRWLGAGAGVLALLLTFDAIRDLTPLDEWANKLANKVSGVIPKGGLGAQTGGGTPAGWQKIAGGDGAGHYPGIQSRVG